MLFNDILYTEPISLAKTVLAYTANEDGMLSFKINVDVTVYSKGAGNRTDLWGVEVYLNVYLIFIYVLILIIS